MPGVIREGTRVHFVGINPPDRPEALAYFLRLMANSLGEEPILEVAENQVTIDCRAAPQMLQFIEGCLEGRLLPVLEGNTVYFKLRSRVTRERGPLN
ncbi:MAG: hypothetical protein C4291_14830 [Candidatus Dadabacteria bacterium]